MKSTYIIGEIGQNHNGSVGLAKKLIEAASMPIIDGEFGRELKPMDAIKLVKRDLDEELARSEAERPYDSVHSFGRTYGEHRAALELSDQEHYELYLYAKERGLDMVETICAPGAMSILEYFTPSRLKVASRDLTNLPLLEALAGTEIPIVLSTGMAGERELEEALAVITKYHDKISILHCLAQYPAQYENMNMRGIQYLIEKYPDYEIGYSDHSVGIMCPVAAVTLGAKIVEKHITLNRNMKGSDHAGSLGLEGMYRMVRDIRNVEWALGKPVLEVHPAARAAKEKLERSVASRRDLRLGEVIREDDVHLLSPGTGIRWAERGKIIGKKAAVALRKDEIISYDDVKL